MPNQKNMIYVIDDDDSVRRAFGRLFRSAGYDVETFPSPDEFLAHARQKENACIIVDVRMPVLTGFGLLETLASGKTSLPVIVVSASDEANIRQHARELGAVSFFRKPVDDQALLDAIWWAISGIEKGI